MSARFGGVLLEKRLDFRFDQEDVWAADTRITEANPLGKVPCLVMEGGEAVFDSRVIVEYVDTLSPVGRLIPEKGRERAEVRTWEALADGVIDAVLLAFRYANLNWRSAYPNLARLGHKLFLRPSFIETAPLA